MLPRSRNLPPGPRIPAAIQTAYWVKRPLPFLEDAQKRYGDTFTIRLLGVGPLVMISRPEDIKTVFTGSSDVLLAGEGNATLAPFVGQNSLLILDREAHLRQRRLLLPPFHGARMQSYGHVMRDLTDDAVDAWPIGEPFPVQPSMQQITLNVILRTVFGMEEGARKQRLGESLTTLLDAIMTPAVTLLGLLQFDFSRHAPWLRLSRLKAVVDEQIFEEIRLARRDPKLEERTDILAMMLKARDEDGQEMSDIEVRDELVTLLVAGHETTATSLSWAMERIALHPAVLEKIEDELKGVVGEGELQPEHVAKLEYLDGVVKESLRSRPILPMVVRWLDAPFQVGGWNLPKGVRVAPCIWLAQRREETYPEPLRFMPERFVGKKVDPYSFLPFGGGVRRCIGMAFALYEMKIVLATILLRTRYRLSEPRPLEVVRRSLTLAPEGGTEIVVMEKRGRGVGRVGRVA